MLYVQSPNNFVSLSHFIVADDQVYLQAFPLVASEPQKLLLQYQTLFFANMNVNLNDIFKRFQIQDFIQQKLLKKKSTDTILALIYYSWRYLDFLKSLKSANCSTKI